MYTSGTVIKIYIHDYSIVIKYTNYVFKITNNNKKKRKLNKNGFQHLFVQ